MKNDKRGKKSPKKFKNFIEEDDYYPDRGMKRNKRRNERRTANQNLRDYVQGGFDMDDISKYNDEQE